MQEKVWYIEDPAEKTVRQKDSNQIGRKTAVLQKSPALAFSLSLMIWGGGQIYGGRTKLGLLFMFLMELFYGSLVFIAVYWGELVNYMASNGVSVAELLIYCGILYLFGLTFWAFNADDAYHGVNRMGLEAFNGIDNRVLPALASAVIPGWGQFLNGQDRKGAVLFGLAIASLFILSAGITVIICWPALAGMPLDRVMEGILVIALVYVPCIPFIWLFGIFDALKVSMDDTKKEPLLERIKYANNRRKMRGWVSGIMPQVKMTLMLGLFLVMCVVIAYHYFPEKYYSLKLSGIQNRLMQQDMVFVPDLIDFVIGGMSHQNNLRS